MGRSGQRRKAKRARTAKFRGGNRPPETQRFRGPQTNQLLPGEGYIEGFERMAESAHTRRRQPRRKLPPRRIAVLVGTMLAFFGGPTLVFLIVYLVNKH